MCFTAFQWVENISSFLQIYTSAQGFTVNIIRDTMGDNVEHKSLNYQSEKIAIFVAGGVRYTLTGHVPTETMKAIVDSMH